LEYEVAGDEESKLDLSKFLLCFTYLLHFNFFILQRYKHVNNKSNTIPPTTMPAIIPELKSGAILFEFSSVFVTENVLLQQQQL